MLYIVYMRFQQAMGLSIHLGIEPIFQGFWNKQKGNKPLELNVIPLLFQHVLRATGACSNQMVNNEYADICLY